MDSLIVNCLQINISEQVDVNWDRRIRQHWSV